MATIEGDLIVSRSYTVYGEWAQLELDLMLRFINSGDVVIDGGAFIGGHTLAFSNAVGSTGKVISFEPRPNVFNILKENVDRCRKSPVEIINRGLSDSNQSLPAAKSLSDTNQGGFSLQFGGAVQPGEPSFLCMALDELNEKTVNFVKLDIEGMEAVALSGAKQLVQKCRPIVFAEVNAFGSGAELLSWAKQTKYLVYGVITPAFNPDNFRKYLLDIFDSARELVFLMLPEERRDNTVEKLSGYLYGLIEREEDIFLCLLHKPHFHLDVLSKLSSATTLSTRFASLYSRDIEYLLHETIKRIDGQPQSDVAQEQTVPAPAGQIIEYLENRFLATSGELNDLKETNTGLTSNLSELRIQFSELREVNSIQSSLIVQNEDTRLRLTSQAEYLTDQINVLNASLVNANSNIDSLNVELATCRGVAAQFQHETIQLKAEIATQKTNLRSLQLEVFNLHSSLDLVYKSRSMAITAPLRNLVRFFRKFI